MVSNGFPFRLPFDVRPLMEDTDADILSFHHVLLVTVAPVELYH